MMSMSMYKPSKAFSSNIREHGIIPSKPKGDTKSVVRRSNSLSFNLSHDSSPIMDSQSRTVMVMGMGETQSSARGDIPEEHFLSTLKLADSIRSDCGDCDDFFLPMDDTTDCDEVDETPNLRSAQHASVGTKLLDQEQKRHAAIARLEHFFLGESCAIEPEAKGNSSPVAVMDLSFKSSPKRNMFGQIMDDGPPQLLKQFSKSAEDSISNETPTFSKLKLSDRAHSLPLTLHILTDASCGGPVFPPLKAISKKPSLKKVSSIGTGMSKKIASEGNLNRTVSFSSLSIREYPPAISDNPSCSFGPPVQLDWEYEAEQTHPIDLYEQSRQPRRASHDLLLSYYDRRFLLIKQAGYSRKEVTEAVKAAERVKRERMLTDLFLPAQALDETFENFIDFVKRFWSKDDTLRE